MTALTNAERQARWRARHSGEMPNAEPEPDMSDLAAVAEITGAAAAGVLIEAMGDIRAILAAPVAQIDHVLRRAGIDPVPVKRRLAAIRTAVKAHFRNELRDSVNGSVIDAWDKLLVYLHLHADERQEHFHALYLDRKNRLLAHDSTPGTIDHCAVYPREIVRRALELGASALILCHNHPSGDPAPSKADATMTQEVRKAGALVGLTLHDHVILGAGGRYASFRALGL